MERYLSTLKWYFCLPSCIKRTQSFIVVDCSHGPEKKWTWEKAFVCHPSICAPPKILLGLQASRTGSSSTKTLCCEISIDSTDLTQHYPHWNKLWLCKKQLLDCCQSQEAANKSSKHFNNWNHTRVISMLLILFLVTWIEIQAFWWKQIDME